MIVALTNLLLSMQPDAVGGGGGGGGGAAAPVAGPAGTAGGPGGAGCIMNIGFLVVMFAVLYFLMIRPQQKQAKQHNEMLKALKRGDVVRTKSGIRGEIVDLEEKDAVLLISDKVKIHVWRTEIAGRDATASPTDKKA